LKLLVGLAIMNYIKINKGEKMKKTAENYFKKRAELNKTSEEELQSFKNINPLSTDLFKISKNICILIQNEVSPESIKKQLDYMNSNRFTYDDDLWKFDLNELILEAFDRSFKNHDQSECNFGDSFFEKLWNQSFNLAYKSKFDINLIIKELNKIK